MPTFQNFIDKTASAYQAPGNETEIIVVPVPMGQTFVLTHFANESNDGRAWGNVRWDIYADGVPVRDYYGVLDQLGLYNQMREIPFGHVVATREIRIYQTNNDTTNTYKLGTSIKGAFLKND